jgi:hypothetical protein
MLSAKLDSMTFAKRLQEVLESNALGARKELDTLAGLYVLPDYVSQRRGL